MLARTKPLAGKVALITGGTRGIGAGIARKLASWGCDLCLNYVERDADAQALCEELTADEITTHLLKADIGDTEQAEEMFEHFRQLYDHLDILILNAASTIFRTLEQLAITHWDFIFNTNGRSTWHLAMLARPLMANRNATIITLSNGAAATHTTRLGPIGASKALLEALTRSLGVELAADGIVVNCVRPGTVATDVMRLRPDFWPRLDVERRLSPQGRVTTVEDCADVVALLCLEEARWIVGQSIVLDGGISQWR